MFSFQNYVSCLLAHSFEKFSEIATTLTPVLFYSSFERNELFFLSKLVVVSVFLYCPPNSSPRVDIFHLPAPLFSPLKSGFALIFREAEMCQWTEWTKKNLCRMRCKGNLCAEAWHDHKFCCFRFEDLNFGSQYKLLFLCTQVQLLVLAKACCVFSVLFLVPIYKTTDCPSVFPIFAVSFSSVTSMFDLDSSDRSSHFLW